MVKSHCCPYYLRNKCIWGPKPSGGFYFLTIEWPRHIVVLLRFSYPSWKIRENALNPQCLLRKCTLQFVVLKRNLQIQ